MLVTRGTSARPRAPRGRRALANALAAVAALGSVVVEPRIALGQDAASCKDAFEQADLAMLEPSGKRLLEARELLRVCASPECKAWMVDECTRSLDAVDARIPTVVFAARGADGEELVEVSVSVGSEILVDRLDGRAIETFPGEKVFAFVTPDGRRVEERVVVREREKSRVVAVTFAAPAPRPPPPAASASPPYVEVQPRGATRTAGWILTGAGALGLAAGAVFGVKAIADKEAARCDAAGLCDRGPLDDARSSATISTIGFVAGAALAAGGLLLVLLSSRPQSRPYHADRAALGVSW